MCRGRRFFDLGLLPLSVGGTMFLAMFICYTIAVLKGHMDAILPAISDTGIRKPAQYILTDTGIRKPEQYIFSQLINIACALSVATFLLRYKMIHLRTHNDPDGRSVCSVVTFLLRYKMIHLRTHNDPDGRSLCCMGLVCCVIGVIGGLGLTVVANFPDDTAKEVHFTGAGFVFGMGTLYQCLDSVLTFKMHPTHNGKTIGIVRSCLAATSLIALVTTVTSSVLFTTVYGGENLKKDQILHWTEGQKGRSVHLVSTFSEWVLGFSFNLYFFTFIREFQNFTSTLDVKFYLCSREGGGTEDALKSEVRTQDPWSAGPKPVSTQYPQADERTSLLTPNTRPQYV